MEEPGNRRFKDRVIGLTSKALWWMVEMNWFLLRLIADRLGRLGRAVRCGVGCEGLAGF